MKIYDISQEVFSCIVYPGDSTPEKIVFMDMGKGDLYNLSGISMCVHNGTHIDAPRHFIKDGKTIEQVVLEKCIGSAWVHAHEGDITAEDAKQILSSAEQNQAGKKILIKGNATVTLEAAEVFAEAEIDLVGNESVSVGPIDAPMAVHLALLNQEVVLLEGIVLKDVPEGKYLLNCAPLNLCGAEGSPCRAILMEME